MRMGVVAALAACLYLGCANSSAHSSAHERSLPTFELPLLSGGTLEQKSLVGKVHVLNFFATWCGPCKMELPDLNKFYTRQDPAKVGMYAIAAGDEHRLDIRAFLDSNEVKFPVALQGEMLLAQLGSDGLPTTVLLDAEGHVQHILKGMVTDAQLTTWVNEMLQNPPGAGH